MKNIIPSIASQVQKVLDEMASLGHPMMCTDGYRTWAEQNALYAQGRVKPGRIVTNARGGESNHNYACAADCTFVVNGKPTWEGNLPWDLYGKTAKKYGFVWGGDWKSFPDRPHIEMTFGYTIPQLQKMGEAKAIKTLSQLADSKYTVHIPEVAADARKSWEKAKKAGLISNKTNPEEVVISETLQWVFANGKVMQAPQGKEKMLQWYVVALDRTGWIDSILSPKK